MYSTGVSSYIYISLSRDEMQFLYGAQNSSLRAAGFLSGSRLRGTQVASMYTTARIGAPGEVRGACSGLHSCEPWQTTTSRTVETHISAGTGILRVHTAGSTSGATITSSKTTQRQQCHNQQQQEEQRDCRCTQQHPQLQQSAPTIQNHALQLTAAVVSCLHHTTVQALYYVVA